VETLLLVWISEKRMAGDSVSDAIICEKAKQLFEELCVKAPGTSTGPRIQDKAVTPGSILQKV
jgi:hypothetical protein